MPVRPKELDFSTPDGREATPERMNRAMDYILARFKAFESVVPEFESVINQLRATGLERLDEVLTPLLADAQGMRDDIAAIKTALEDPAWRDALIADVVEAGLIDPVARAAFIDDVITEIASRQLYIETGAGSAGANLTSGTAAPNNADGADGDLYVQFVP